MLIYQTAYCDQLSGVIQPQKQVKIQSTNYSSQDKIMKWVLASNIVEYIYIFLFMINNTLLAIRIFFSKQNFCCIVYIIGCLNMPCMKMTPQKMQILLLFRRNNLISFFQNFLVSSTSSTTNGNAAWCLCKRYQHIFTHYIFFYVIKGNKM